MTDLRGVAAERRPANPYVGPQSLGPMNTVYGRAGELNELRDLLIARRIVLLYSPSGAGKSSLLEARTGLRAELTKEGFDVLRTVRVSLEETPSPSHTWLEQPPRLEPRNRYVWSVLSSLEEGRPDGARFDAARLATITLDDYLAELAERDGDRDICLFFDQFEELFTLDDTDYEAKEAFLAELGLALRDDARWAVFAMREDFIALLDPYVSKLPTRLATRFRMDLLEETAAIAAARGPAVEAGVSFSVEAARQLVKELRRVKVLRRSMGDGGDDYGYGKYVEPVQLQVVCRQLWDDVHRRAGDHAVTGDVS